VALNAFIIRPFGTKEVILGASVRAEPNEVKAQDGKVVARLVAEGPLRKLTMDFDHVHRVLIGPALRLLGIDGQTTQEVVSAGNIREDMFHRLLTADLVIADLSIHNPNVFYELGVRQAFRDKYTFLMRCDVSDYPFDLRTDRYLEYRWDNPAASLEDLVRAVRETVSSDKPDSPVFKLLPKLLAEDRSQFLTVPRDFVEEVDRAHEYRRPGDLQLLAIEAAGYLWETEALRLVGRAQFALNYINGAKVTWEMILGRYPDDVEANTVLSTIYQRLNDLARSDQALARMSSLGSLNAGRLSQVHALVGRNLKARWMGYWDGVPDQKEREERALWSPLLQRAYDAYAKAFKANLNDAYAGLNALTLLLIQTELAVRHPKLWRDIQERPDEAERELGLRKERIRSLIAAVQLAVEADRDRLTGQARVDFWAEVLEAAVECIVSEQPERVAQMYRDAIEWAPPDVVRTMRHALKVYEDLRIEGCLGDEILTTRTMRENIAKALSELEEDEARARGSHADRILVFTGLRLDPDVRQSRSPAGLREPISGGDEDGAGAESGRRFPREAVEGARAAILEAVKKEKELAEGRHGKVLFGIAAGAGGGDLLFHEVCRSLEIETRLYLALPKEQYIGEYVAPAGPEWVESFRELYRRLDGDRMEPEIVAGVASEVSGYLAHPVKRRDALTRGRPVRVNVLAESKELPRWLRSKPYYSIGRRNTLWMLQHALGESVLHGDAEVTLIVLWDGCTRGGTWGFGATIALAERCGIKVRRIDPGAWLRAGSPSTAPSLPPN
jgi:hypothetical protein